MRNPAALSSKTEKRLCAYALAAGASGIGVLALVQPSEAEIVYTSADVTITVRKGASFDLDVNGDGITDFILGGGIDNDGSLYVRGVNGNRVMGLESAGSSACYASALQDGRGIGPQRLCFESQPAAAMVFAGRGLWANVSDRYLGLRFDIDHEEHYGWARLTVRVTDARVMAHLTGYAYETRPNQPIKAGQISDDDASAEPDTPGSARFAAALGALALGSDGIGLRRREDEK